jgi:SHS family lactate transporter-like MFS transporter
VLVFFIRRGIEESPSWLAQRALPRAEQPVAPRRERNVKLAVYAVVLMTAFNFLSHGSQDAYPTFLRVQHHFDTRLTSLLTAVANVGAICGGLLFGSLSERIGRRRAIIIAALLALPALPFWAYGSTPLILGLGAFLIQLAVQGAWGVVPVHLNELSPPQIRGTFPGFVYQIGNLLAAVNLNLQVAIAESHREDYGLALTIVVACSALAITVLAAFGPERHGVSMTGERRPAPAGAITLPPSADAAR